MGRKRSVFADEIGEQWTLRGRGGNGKVLQLWRGSASGDDVRLSHLL